MHTIADTNFTTHSEVDASIIWVCWECTVLYLSDTIFTGCNVRHLYYQSCTVPLLLLLKALVPAMPPWWLAVMHTYLHSCIALQHQVVFCLTATDLSWAGSVLWPVLYQITIVAQCRLLQTLSKHSPFTGHHTVQLISGSVLCCLCLAAACTMLA